MEVRFTRDEAYPVYELSEETWAKPLEVDDETAQRWRETQDAWDRMQAEIEAAASKNAAYFDGRLWHI